MSRQALFLNSVVLVYKKSWALGYDIKVKHPICETLIGKKIVISNIFLTSTEYPFQSNQAREYINPTS